MSDGQLRVAAYGFFGIGNLGNEGSLASLIAYLREAHPQATLSCFSADPSAVKAAHGLPGMQLMAYRNRAARNGALAAAHKALGRLLDIPRTFRMVGRTDVVVVPGMGVLEEQLGVRPWGLPYWLLVMVAACRLRGRKVLLVSVGAERPTDPITRLFFRWTVRLADYRSFRDRYSLEAVQAMGVTRNTGGVYPDLAFALPGVQGIGVRPGHVAIGVMAYYGKLDDQVRGASVRQAYVERMTDLITRLTDEGLTVTLIVGDRVDLEVAREISGCVSASRPSISTDSFTVSNEDTLAGIMLEMAKAEVVVASRFHNVLCALKLARPTISLGYADKNDQLMTEFGLGAYCQRIDTFDTDLLMAQIGSIRCDHDQREVSMASTVRRYEDELQEQFRHLSAQFLRSSQPATAAVR